MEIAMNLWELEEETQEICLKLLLNVKTEEFLIPIRNRKQVFSKWRLDLKLSIEICISLYEFSLKTLEYSHCPTIWRNESTLHILQDSDIISLWSCMIDQVQTLRGILKGEVKDEWEVKEEWEVK